MAQKGQPESVINNSLGLKALCQRLQDAAGCDILELGPARSRNIEFLSRFSPSIYIADLRSSLPLPPMPDDPDLPGPDWDRMLDLPANRGFDVVLAWDLLNYIELPAISGLIGYLSRFCHPGTVVFMMIFDKQTMPEEITVYQIIDETHLHYELGSSATRACPRHQPHALNQIMRRFRTLDSFRLRNGVNEYLFAYEG
jgi:hypothetical protein